MDWDGKIPTEQFFLKTKLQFGTIILSENELIIKCANMNGVKLFFVLKMFLKLYFGSALTIEEKNNKIIACFVTIRYNIY